MPTAISATAFFIAALFALSATHKAKNLREFAGVVRAYELAPGGAAGAIAGVLVAAEAVAVGLLLMWPSVGAAGFVLASLLFALYGAAIIVNLVRGRTNIDCGCGWSSARASGARLTVWHAARAIMLAIGALAATIGAGGAAAAAAPELIVIGALSATPFLIAYAAADTLIENWSKLTGAAA